jgi:hypothetical protein
VLYQQAVAVPILCLLDGDSPYDIQQTLTIPDLTGKGDEIRDLKQRTRKQSFRN